MSILLENLSGIGNFIETHNSDSGRNKNPKSSMYKYITELKSIVQKHPTRQTEDPDDFPDEFF